MYYWTNTDACKPSTPHSLDLEHAAGDDENETYGFEITHLDGLDGVDEAEDSEMPEPEMLFETAGGNEDIVIDPNASEEELKRTLQKRYGRYIGGLKAEFNRVRKKGKLPGSARRILKDWFNSHSFWPYPSVRTSIILHLTLLTAALASLQNIYSPLWSRHCGRVQLVKSDVR